MTDPTKWLTSLSDLGKVPTRIIVFVFVSSGLILILPNSVAARFHLEKFRESFGGWIGVACLLAAVLLFTTFCGWAIKKWNYSRVWKHQFEKIIEAMTRLDPTEKAVLREFFLQGQNTIRLPIDEPTVAGLRAKGIIQLVGRNGSATPAGIIFSFALSPIAHDHLMLDQIDFPQNPTESDFDRIDRSRPAFVPQILELEQRRQRFFRRG